MWDLCRLIWWVVVDLFRPRAKLEAEILVLRQQINVLRRTAPKRLLLSSIDRLILVGLYRLFPDVRGALAIVKPDTVIRWHRAGFRAYWRWKSRTRGGPPLVYPNPREIIETAKRIEHEGLDNNRDRHDFVLIGNIFPLRRKEIEDDVDRAHQRIEAPTQSLSRVFMAAPGSIRP